MERINFSVTTQTYLHQQGTFPRQIAFRVKIKSNIVLQKHKVLELMGMTSMSHLQDHGAPLRIYNSVSSRDYLLMKESELVYRLGSQYLD